jgi:hypothetical protein
LPNRNFLVAEVQEENGPVTKLLVVIIFSKERKEHEAGMRSLVSRLRIPSCPQNAQVDSLMLDAFSKWIEANSTSRTLPRSEGSGGRRRDSRSRSRSLGGMMYRQYICEVLAIVVVGTGCN